MTEPCYWPVSYAGCGTCDELTTGTPEDQAIWEAMAGTYLWNWTNQVYGLCPVSVRPCRQDCGDNLTRFWGLGPFTSGSAAVKDLHGWGPVAVGEAWYVPLCGSCHQATGCSCTHLESIELPGPIDSVEQVLIDGAVLPPTSYRVDSRKYLIRTDGGEWPACQDLNLPTTDVGTWQVDYLRGTPVPQGGQIAAGILACEFAKAACNSATCRLPQRVQSITRQGVTIAMLDNFEDIDTGHTGIWLIDSWVASVTKPKRGGRVFSPDYRPKNQIVT